MEREVVVLRLVHLVEWVPTDSVNVDSLFWVSLKNLTDDVLGVGRQELGQRVVGGEDFLVKIRRFLVLKREVAANHSVKNDTD